MCASSTFLGRRTGGRAGTTISCNIHTLAHAAREGNEYSRQGTDKEAEMEERKKEGRKEKRAELFFGLDADDMTVGRSETRTGVV